GSTPTPMHSARWSICRCATQRYLDCWFSPATARSASPPIRARCMSAASAKSSAPRSSVSANLDKAGCELAATPEATNQAYLTGFLAHLRHERRLSGNTAQSYARDVGKLFELAGITPLADIHPHQGRRYVAILHGRGLEGRTLARMLSAW